MHQTLTTSDELLMLLKENGVIPFFNHQDADILLQILKILDRCGCRVFEIAHPRDARGLRLFAWLAEHARNMNMLLGVGTVPDASQASRFIQAGAQFIASPFLHKDTAKVCYDHQVVWMPGCTSCDDVARARDLGAVVVSVVPGNILGPDFLREVTIAYPDLFFIPSGGVTRAENNLKRWFDAGALCVRLGESLFAKQDVAVKDWVKLEHNITKALQGIRQVKTSILRNKAITL
ncbi:MAG TPA: hypothetical protein VIM75_16695 [Ohtaekwangia sp.]|uniref:hypothetical protein n=1 Tax=Ohtaekwangia sp. TaxID=2066019 RepID=UPI002F92C508